MQIAQEQMEIKMIVFKLLKKRIFFYSQACRLLQEMIEIPLEGFLLTPVQKICKYPLQLNELLKYTPVTHPDHVHIKGALEAMKKIATLINERKRKMESIEKLAYWQTTVEDWQVCINYIDYFFSTLPSVIHACIHSNCDVWE